MLFKSLKLSSVQLHELTELQQNIQNSKLKEILKNAIETWKEQKVIRATFGIAFNNENEIIPLPCGCCLIGASLVGTTTKATDFLKAAIEKYNLSEEEFKEIYKAFDKSYWSASESEINTELTKEVNEIRKIVFGE